MEDDESQDSANTGGSNSDKKYNKMPDLELGDEINGVVEQFAVGIFTSVQNVTETTIWYNDLLYTKK